MTKEDLEQKILEKLTINELALHFNTKYTTIRYWLEKYKLKTLGHKKTSKWTEENIRNAISKAESIRNILDIIGVSRKSGNYQTLYRYCIQYGIDVEEIKNNVNYLKCTKIYVNNEIFTINSSIPTSTVKKRILRDKLIPYICECGNGGEWMGKILKLQLDHINGVNNDHRLENLRFLCPNCHSQTITFSGKNKKA